MATPEAPGIDAWIEEGTNVRLAIDGRHSGGNIWRDANALYTSRWQQWDNTWSPETRIEGAEYYGGDPSPDYPPTPNRKYRYRVRGRNADGFGPYAYSPYYIQTVPNTPSGASASLVGPNAITFSWADNAYGVAYYAYNQQIWWNINGGGWGHYTTVGAGTTSFHFSGLSPGATYQFAVRAVEQDDDPRYADKPSAFAYSNVVTSLTVPNAPVSVGATRNSDSQATITWVNQSNGGAPYDSLTLQRWDNVGNAWGTIANLSGGATSATDSGLVANRKYQWRVIANNSVGSSGAGYSGNVFMTPSAPTNAVGKYVGGTTVNVTWANTCSYSEYGVRIQPYKNGVADGAVIALGTGSTTYDLTGVDNTATYYFKVWAVSDVGALSSGQVQSNSVTAAAPPGAPGSLTVTPGQTFDVDRTHTFSWVHNASSDGSAQTQRQLRYREAGTTIWAEGALVATSSTSITNALKSAGFANGKTVEWQVRTWGVHPDPSPWSSTVTVTTSTTPTVNITGPDPTITTSDIVVDWAYFDAEGTPQTEWRVDLYEQESGDIVERQSGTGTTATFAMGTAATDGLTYRVEVTVRDESGLWSDKAVRTFTAAFLPPAEVLLTVELDNPSGAGILTMTRTADDGGVTTFPASAVTIERQFYDLENETWSEWEVLIDHADPDALLIDTTAPTHDDGQYRITTHSDAPTSYRSTTVVKPPPIDNRWLYVSGGPKFDVVCKMWANIEIEQTASRAKALHYFAGRKNPVIYSGEAAERTYSISGILEEEASPPEQWIRLARQPGAVLLRAPGRRMYGSLSEVSIERIQNKLHKVSFSIQEVSL
jgi:hypothetical protein